MVSRADWAGSLLRWIDASESTHNRHALVAWVSAEGTTARWNPLASTQPMPGATNFNSVGVKNYTSWEQGLEATAKTLSYPHHHYEPIVRLLLKGARAKRTLKAVEASDWGTGGLALQILPDVKRYWSTYADQPIGQ